MKVKFKTMYMGRETAGKLHTFDDVLELDQQPALDLIAAGVAVEVQDAPAQDEQPAPKKKEKVKHVEN